jgi:hypothetical protein
MYNQQFFLIINYNICAIAPKRTIIRNPKFPSTLIPSDFAGFVQLTVAVPLHAVGEGPEEGMGVGVMFGCAIKNVSN